MQSHRLLSSALKVKLLASLGGLAVAALAAAPLLVTGCGGCPWIRSSEITLEPATPCLEIEASDGDSSTPSGDGGCVNPILFGKNSCAEPVTFLAASTGTEDDIVVEPGAKFELAVSLDKSTEADDTYTFEVDALVGDAPLKLTFRTFTP